MVGHQVNHRVFRVGVDFRGVRVGKPQHVARKFNDGDLKPQANAEVGDLVFPRIFRRADFTRNAARTEPAGHQNAVGFSENFRCVIVIQRFGIHPVDVDFCVVCEPAVFERFVDAQIRVVQFDIFTDKRDVHALLK